MIGVKIENAGVWTILPPLKIMLNSSEAALEYGVHLLLSLDALKASAAIWLAIREGLLVLEANKCSSDNTG